MKLLLKDFTFLSLDENKELLNIRNSDYVRFNMKSSEKIELENHLKFVEKLKHDKKNIYYAVFNKDEIVGAIYITEITQNSSSWGLYIKKGAIPYISSLCTYLLIQRIFNKLNLEKICLEVKKSNTSAYKLDLSFGFEVFDEIVYDNEEYFLMHLKKQTWQSFKSNAVMKILKNKIDKIEYEFKEK